MINSQVLMFLCVSACSFVLYFLFYMYLFAHLSFPIAFCSVYVSCSFHFSHQDKLALTSLFISRTFFSLNYATPRLHVPCPPFAIPRCPISKIPLLIPLVFL